MKNLPFVKLHELEVLQPVQPDGRRRKDVGNVVGFETDQIAELVDHPDLVFEFFFDLRQILQNFFFVRDLRIFVLS
jgi:hypothetical protein